MTTQREKQAPQHTNEQTESKTMIDGIAKNKKTQEVTDTSTLNMAVICWEALDPVQTPSQFKLTTNPHGTSTVT